MIDQDIVNLIGLPGELYKNIDGKNFHDSHQNCLLVYLFPTWAKEDVPHDLCEFQSFAVKSLFWKGAIGKLGIGSVFIQIFCS